MIVAASVSIFKGNCEGKKLPALQYSLEVCCWKAGEVAGVVVVQELDLL